MFMDLTENDVVKILKLLEESDFEELYLETGDLKLIVSKTGQTGLTRELEAVPAGPSRPADPIQQPAPPVRQEAGISATAGAKVQKGEVGGTASCEEEGLVAITASSVGTFYRFPKPGAPPFVEIGTFVTEDDTVCLLEVMKCYQSVKAKVRGYIAKILAENGQMVEFGQELFLIKLAENKE